MQVGKGKREGKMEVKGVKVEKWEGGEGNQVSGNFMQPCILTLFSVIISQEATSF